MSPEWIMVGIAALGIVGHLLLSARDRGRFEQQVMDLKEEVGRERARVGQCQLAENCEREMEQMADRIKSAHKRMDRQDGRLDGHDKDIRELHIKVAALKAPGE